MLIGGVSIALMQAAVKLLSSDLHPFLITLYRAALVFIVLLPILLWKGFAAVKTSSDQSAGGKRGGWGYWHALRIHWPEPVSLAEATALLFTVPIFATLLSVIFLDRKGGRSALGSNSGRVCRNHYNHKT